MDCLTVPPKMWCGKVTVKFLKTFVSVARIESAWIKVIGCLLDPEIHYELFY